VTTRHLISLDTMMRYEPVIGWSIEN